MKKEMIAILVLVCVLLISGCTSQNQSDKTANDPISTLTNDASAVQKVEVLHFHGNHQCQGCINVGKCAEDAVNEYFQSEQKSGTVVFAHVNGDLPENAGLVQQYGATGSSLWIGVYDKDGGFSKEQNTNVWYKTSDMEKCREYIKGVIEEKLSEGKK
jgi:hypothetical protein